MKEFIAIPIRALLLGIASLFDLGEESVPMQLVYKLDAWCEDDGPGGPRAA